MKISRKVLKNSLIELSKTTTNKFWGVIAIISSINEVIVPNKTYEVKSSFVMGFLDDLFNLNFNTAEKNDYNESILYVKFSTIWKQQLKNLTLKNIPRLEDLAIYYNKNNHFNQAVTINQLKHIFVDECNIELNGLVSTFSNQNEDQLIEVEEYDHSEFITCIEECFKVVRKNGCHFSFEPPYFIQSRPSELKRAPFVQTLYSGDKIKELLLISDTNLEDLYPVETEKNKNEINTFELVSNLNDIFKSIGLIFEDQLVFRFLASLQTKKFSILTGLTGSGKTKLAQAFVQWICATPSQYKIIPVGADWTNREPLLGYPNGLDAEKYESPESGALKLLMDAVNNPDKPYFMILDEMNLSHVERYFADFLSVMESNDKIKLYDGAERNDGHGEIVPNEITWPQNLFIIGTVNIDETTYMFSPKVLDRANVIEFRIHEADMIKFLGNNQKPKMELLFMEENQEKGGIGQTMAADFLKKAIDKDIVRHKETEKQDLINKALHDFFIELQKVGAEFGYRTASEIELLLSNLEEYIPKIETRLDIAIMQKLLPKLHGSRKKLIDPLETLAGLCIDNEKLDVKQTGRELYKHWNELKDGDKDKHIRFKISFEKIMRMHHNSIQNGYTSYAEA